MRNGFSTLNVKTAVGDHSKVSDFCSLQTTLDFGQLIPIFATELVPGDKFNVNAEVFSRCAPLVVPTYGKAEIKTASFFIPYYQVAKDADAWLSGQVYYRGKTTYQRCIEFKELFSFFNHSDISTTVTTSNFDFQYKSGNNFIKKKFTKFGKFCYKVLRNLGYQIPAGVDLTSGSSWLTGVGVKTVSAYPLLAFFKAYNDWLYQSQAFNTSLLTNFLYEVKLGNNVGTDYLNGKISAAGIIRLFNELRVLYANDYITSAWRYPNSPMGNDTFSEGVPYQRNENSVFYTSRTTSNNTVKATVISGSTPQSISQRALDFLKRFDDWVRRNNYSGSRDVQQLYSRFGIKTDDFQSHYAYLLDRSTYPLQVGDVTSTADTEGAELGSYAGKGIISSECKTSFESSDYGLLLVVAWIAVKPVYADGFDKMVLRSEPFDYFNPEFDALGPQAISVMEVCERNKDFSYDSSSAQPSDGVFGFTEKYNDYRIFRDKVSGDFALYDKSGMDAWHFNRDLHAVRNNGTLIAQSASIMYMDNIESEYNRIFQFTDGHEDSFYLTIGFHVDSLRPMKSLNQVARLGDGNKVIERNGNTVQ